MIENYTADHHALIGDSTDDLVAEAVYYLNQHDATTPADVIAFLSDRLALTEHEAADRLRSALVAGDVGLEPVPGKPGLLLNTWDDMQRMRRRAWFWTLDRQGVHVPAHLPGECMIARAAVADCLEVAGIATWEHMLAMVTWLAAYDDDDFALHAMLNAWDTGAIAVDHSHGERPVHVTNGWHEGLGS